MRSSCELLPHCLLSTNCLITSKSSIACDHQGPMEAINKIDAYFQRNRDCMVMYFPSSSCWTACAADLLFYLFLFSFGRAGCIIGQHYDILKEYSTTALWICTCHVNPVSKCCPFKYLLGISTQCILGYILFCYFFVYMCTIYKKLHYYMLNL